MDDRCFFFVGDGGNKEKNVGNNVGNNVGIVSVI